MHRLRWSDHLTLQCMADITQKPFEVISVGAKNVVKPQNPGGRCETLVLAFFQDCHYDAVMEWIDQDRGPSFDLTASQDSIVAPSQ